MQHAVIGRYIDHARTVLCLLVAEGTIIFIDIAKRRSRNEQRLRINERAEHMLAAVKQRIDTLGSIFIASVTV